MDSQRCFDGSKSPRVTDVHQQTNATLGRYKTKNQVPAQLQVHFALQTVQPR